MGVSVANEELPSEVSRFIISYIDSVELLNVLILISNSSTLTVPQINAELRSTESSIERRIQDLYSRNVLIPQSDSKHHFRVLEELLPAIRMLETAYRERPLKVIELIYSQPPMALRIFADAFRIRKEEK